MEQNLPVNTFLCTQCGGELHPDEGQIFLTCPYCSSSVYIDKSRVVFHWAIAPTIDDNKARSALARWMAGNQTVKDLDKKARLLSATFEYFPVWYFKIRRNNRQEEIMLTPAAATSVSEIRHIKVPAGDLRKYDSQLDPQSVPPSIPLEATLRWLEQQNIPKNEIAEQAIVHVPIFTFKYQFQNTVYTALVEAATGGVYANLFPAKAEAPYRLAGILTALIYLCLACMPIFGAAADGGEGTGLGLLACIGLGIVIAPFVFFLAVWVAAKV
jgi:DNA-directed RNA polymerase subunit RPC12/RpoP